MATPDTEGRTWRWLVGGTFGACSMLYAATMAPTIYNLDSAELSVAAASGGLVHATGYPLYLLIGRFWCRIPVGDVGFRMNLLSVVCGALTVALVVMILRRLGVRPAPALAAAGLLATSRFFWAMSLVAEVYTLHTALCCVVILLLLRWAEDPRPHRLGVATFATVLGAGNHASMVLLAPACLWFVLATDRRQALRVPALAAAAGGLVLGASIYLYLPWLYLAEPAFNYVGAFDVQGHFDAVDLTTPEGLWWLVSGQAFAERFFASESLLERALHLARELWRNSVVVAMGPALVGLAVAVIRHRAMGVALLLVAGANAAFYLPYGVADTDTMYLPIYLVWSLWVGLGFQWLIEWAEGDRASGHSLRALHGLLAALVIVAVAWNGPLVDLSDDVSSRELGEAVCGQVPAGAVFIGSWDSAPVVEYLQLVEGRCPEVDVINQFHVRSEDLPGLVLGQLQRRPVFVDQRVAGRLTSLEAVGDGPAYRLRLP